MWRDGETGEVGKEARKERRRTGPGHREGSKYRRSKDLRARPGVGAQRGEKAPRRQMLSSIWKVSLAGKVRLGIHFWQVASSSGILLQGVSWRISEVTGLFTVMSFFPFWTLSTCTLQTVKSHDGFAMTRAMFGKSRSEEAHGGMIIIMEPRSAERRPPLPRLSL